MRASTASDTCELTVLMPCLNEAITLGACIAKARISLARMGVPHEIVVADNGSTDGTWLAVQAFKRDPRVTLIRNLRNQRSEFAARFAMQGHCLAID